MRMLSGTPCNIQLQTRRVDTSCDNPIWDPLRPMITDKQSLWRVWNPLHLMRCRNIWCWNFPCQPYPDTSKTYDCATHLYTRTGAAITSENPIQNPLQPIFILPLSLHIRYVCGGHNSVSEAVRSLWMKLLNCITLERWRRYVCRVWYFTMLWVRHT